MKHGSLYTGIGGFDLAAQWMGWENVFQVEIDPFCQKVLEKNFPKTKRYADIRNFNGKQYAGAVDIITGGFPCQKYSQAGRKSGNDPLKNESLRVLSEALPSWALLENVSNFIGKQFAEEHDSLCSYLENIGYEVQTYDIDAASCGLPTMERHVWIVAKNLSIGTQRGRKKGLQNKSQEGSTLSVYDNIKRIDEGWLLSTPRLCRVGERVSNRVDRLKSLGNAIPPHVAYEFFKAIELTYL